MGLERWGGAGAQDEGFADAGGAKGSSSLWEGDRARMWVLGRWGSQLPTSIPHPVTVFPTRIGFEVWVSLLLSSWKPGVCVCVCVCVCLFVREREGERERERETEREGFKVF